jgi:hypothetical protein
MNKPFRSVPFPAVTETDAMAKKKNKTRRTVRTIEHAILSEIGKRINERIDPDLLCS